MQVMSDYSRDKGHDDLSDFRRFVHSCKKELIRKRETICFTLDQVNELKKEFNLDVIEQDGTYILRIKEELEK